MFKTDSRFVFRVGKNPANFQYVLALSYQKAAVLVARKVYRANTAERITGASTMSGYFQAINVIATYSIDGQGKERLAIGEAFYLVIDREMTKLYQQDGKLESILNTVR